MAWIEPIIDRSATDIKNKTSKAYLNYTDLNRIEGNTEYLKDLLISYGYSNGITNLSIKTNWTYSDLITRTEADRIRNNINALRDTFCNLSTLQTIVFDNTFTYTQLNVLESNEKELDTYINYMSNSFNYCNDIYSI